jgi:hypothetical protein
MPSYFFQMIIAIHDMTSFTAGKVVLTSHVNDGLKPDNKYMVDQVGIRLMFVRPIFKYRLPAAVVLIYTGRIL